MLNRQSTGDLRNILALLASALSMSGADEIHSGGFIDKVICGAMLGLLQTPGSNSRCSELMREHRSAALLPDIPVSCICWKRNAVRAFDGEPSAATATTGTFRGCSETMLNDDFESVTPRRRYDSVNTGNAHLDGNGNAARPSECAPRFVSCLGDCRMGR